MANEDDHISDVGSTFDFKGFILKIFSYWQLVLVSVAISLGVAYYNNVRKLPVYQLGNSISIKDDQNPFFSANTSLTFNWGGVSDKVSTATTILKSRSHNEEVVSKLQYYLQYLKEGEYQRIDAYGSTPFLVEVDTNRFQAINLPISINFKDEQTFSLSAQIPSAISTQNYGSKEKGSMNLEPQEFSRDFKVDEPIELPFFSGTVTRNNQALQAGAPFYLNFMNFDGAVGQYRGVSIGADNMNSSMLNLSMTGGNKTRIVEYLMERLLFLARTCWSGRIYSQPKPSDL